MKEIEQRASVPISKLPELIEHLEAKGAQWKFKNRFMMDFSSSVSDRKFTCAVRVNNGEVELVAKSGGTADVERLESQIVAKNDLSEVIETLAILGFTKASCGIRLMQECVLGGVEYSIRRVVNMSEPETIAAVQLEVELIGGGDVLELDSALKELGYKALTSDETIAVFEKFHTEYNTDFIYSEANCKDIVAIAKRQAY